MAKASSQAERRRSTSIAEAKRRIQQRRRQRLFGLVGVGVLVVLLVGLGAWRLTGGEEEVTASQPLHQFDTQDFHSLAFDPNDPDTIFFGHHYGLMVSHDAGATWQPGPPQGVDAMQQAIPLADPDRRYVAGHDVFQVSNDGGQTWDAPSTNLPSLDIHGFAAAPSDPDRLYAFEVVTTSFYASADGGATWKARVMPLGERAGMMPIAVAGDDPDHLYAGVAGKIAESSDGGQTWQEASDPGGMIVGLAVDLTDSNVLYVTTSEGFKKRGHDGSWTTLPITPDGLLLAVAVHPSDTERIAVVDQQGNFYRSDDGGRTWATK